MTTEVIDLSGQEQAGATTAKRGKFVVLARDSHLILILGPLDRYPYHAELLFRFAQDHRTPCHWIKRPDQLQIDDPHYRVLGGGYIEIDRGRRKTRVSGSSKAYGYFDTEAVQLITSTDSYFADLAVQVDI